MADYFWENKKYENLTDKETFLNELDEFFDEYDFSRLPSFSSLKNIFLVENKTNLNNYKVEISYKIKRASEKKTLKDVWKYKNFSENLEKRIKKFDDYSKLEYWINILKEYYRVKKSGVNNA